MAYLELRGLSKAYGSTWAVREVTLSVQQGEVVSLLGPSGCGKTTTLNMIAGFIQPTGGHIELDGQALDRVPPNRRDTSMVFQNYALFPHMTVSQNVAFGLEMRRVPRAERERRVGEVLTLVELGELGGRYPRQMSGGQQQRVALARALVTRPKVLLLDEPLSNLDAKLRHEMRREIRRIQQRTKITTVFVTHDQEEALTISDRIAVLNEGAVEQVGTAVEIYEHPRSVFVAGFIGKGTMLPAEVVGIEAKHLVARTPGGVTIYCGASGEQRVGDRVVIVLRPERLRIAREDPTATNRLAATVESVLYLGSALHITLAADGLPEPIEVHQPGTRAGSYYQVGDPVIVEWEPEDACLISA